MYFPTLQSPDNIIFVMDGKYILCISYYMGYLAILQVIAQGKGNTPHMSAKTCYIALYPM